jgi:hypothetical protein
MKRASSAIAYWSEFVRHALLMQTSLVVVQSTQAAPRLPQAVSSAPMRQVPFGSQQPVHVVAQLGAPAS